MVIKRNVYDDDDDDEYLMSVSSFLHLLKSLNLQFMFIENDGEKTVVIGKNLNERYVRFT